MAARPRSSRATGVEPAARSGRYQQRAIRRSAPFVSTLGPASTPRADYCFDAFDQGASTKAASNRSADLAKLKDADGVRRVTCSARRAILPLRRDGVVRRPRWQSATSRPDRRRSWAPLPRSGRRFVGQPTPGQRAADPTTVPRALGLAGPHPYLPLDGAIPGLAGTESSTRSTATRGAHGRWRGLTTPTTRRASSGRAGGPARPCWSRPTRRPGWPPSASRGCFSGRRGPARPPRPSSFSWPTPHTPAGAAP